MINPYASPWKKRLYSVVDDDDMWAGFFGLTAVVGVVATIITTIGWRAEDLSGLWVVLSIAAVVFPIVICVTGHYLTRSEQVPYSRSIKKCIQTYETMSDRYKQSHGKALMDKALFFHGLTDMSENDREHQIYLRVQKMENINEEDRRARLAGLLNQTDGSDLEYADDLTKAMEQVRLENDNKRPLSLDPLDLDDRS